MLYNPEKISKAYNRVKLTKCKGCLVFLKSVIDKPGYSHVYHSKRLEWTTDRTRLTSFKLLETGLIRNGKDSDKLYPVMSEIFKFITLMHGSWKT